MNSGWKHRLVLGALGLLLAAWPAGAGELFYCSNGKGHELPHPALYSAGPTLILSNGPESIVSPSPAALYRDRVSGNFRVFLHHTNKAGVPLQLGIALTNTSDVPGQVLVQAGPQGVPFVAETDPTVAGARVFQLWLEARTDNQPTFTLAPGQTRWLPINVPSLATTTAMVDGTSTVPLTITIASGDKLDDDPLSMPMAALGAPFRRGTFPHGERQGDVTYDQPVLSWIDVGSPPAGRWSRVSPGEYERGTDATTGHEVYDDGNFGVVYRLQVHVRPQPAPLSLMLDAAGGLSRFVLALDGRSYEFPGPIMSYQAWRFLKMDPSGGDFELLTTIPGGSNGAARLYFVPQEVEGDLTPGLKGQS